MFERIVLAVDGSEPARRAVPVAADIASKYGAEVIAVHVLEQQLGRGGPIAFDTTEEANRVADDTARALKDVGVSARPEARAAIAGRAAQEIIDVATSEDAGLIVMGSRGMSDWEGLLSGRAWFDNGKTIVFGLVGGYFGVELRRPGPACG